MIAKESRMKRQWICERVVVPALLAVAGAHVREVFVWRMAS